MKMLVQKKIGITTYTFEVEGKNLFECEQEAQKLSFDNVNECGICGSNELYLNSRLAQGKFKYVEVKCHKCGGAVVFGTKQDDPDTYYLRKNEDKSLCWTKYSPNGEEAPQNTNIPNNRPQAQQVQQPQQQRMNTIPANSQRRQVQAYQNQNMQNGYSQNQNYGYNKIPAQNYAYLL